MASKFWEITRVTLTPLCKRVEGMLKRSHNYNTTVEITRLPIRCGHVPVILLLNGCLYRFPQLSGVCACI